MYGEKKGEMKGETEGERNMNITEALNITQEEFEKLSNEYNGFDGEFYSNHQIRGEGESMGQFLLRGSERIKNTSIIRR